MKTRLYLTPADHGRAVSLEEFTSAAAQEGYRYELIHGRIEVSPIAEMPHDELVDWLKDALNAYRRQHPEIINKVKGPARVFLPTEDEEVTAPEPDVVAYQGFPTDTPLGDRRWRAVSPLLVIEVISEDTAEKDLTRNRRLYLQVPSIREYWVLDPRESADRPTLLVLRRSGRRWGPMITVPPGGTYTTRLLPDFRLVIDPHQEA